MARYRNPLDHAVKFSKELPNGRCYWITLRPGEEIEWDDAEQMSRCGLVRMGSHVTVRSVQEVPIAAIPAIFGAKSLDDKDVANLLDQNAQTVMKRLNDLNLTKEDYKSLLKAEIKGRNRKNVIDTLRKKV